MTLTNGKMLARYDPAKKIWGEWQDLTGKLQPRDAPVIRRLHRHRERQMVRDLINDELAVSHVPEPAWLVNRPWRIDDEYSHGVAWREHMDNDEGLAYVDFDGGRYTVESEAK